MGFRFPFLLVPPRVTVLPKSRVELGKPNVLICIVDDIFPPVISVTWLRNSQPVTKGVTQTSFYSQPNHMFRKFHYLTFVPSAEDVYDCRVEHWGQGQPRLGHWGKQGPLSAHPCSQDLLPQHPTVLTASIHFPQKRRNQSRSQRQWRPRSVPWAWWWACWASWLAVCSS